MTEKTDFIPNITPEEIARIEAETAIFLAGLKEQEEERRREAEAKKGRRTRHNPASVMEQRARKIRRALQLAEKPPDDPLLSLYEHARMLDVLFRQLMLDSAESEAFDERDGLALALRTHAYYRQAISTLDNAGRSGVRPRRKLRTDY